MQRSGLTRCRYLAADGRPVFIRTVSLTQPEAAPAVHVAALTIELRLPAARSLKEKRAIVRPIVEGARRRFAIAAAEVDDADLWNRATLGMAAVSGSARHASQVLDAAERFVWSFPEVEVTASHRSWISDEDE